MIKRIIPLVGVVFLAACSGEKKVEISATDSPAAEATSNASAPSPELDLMIRSAEAALKQKSEMEAVATLQSLREAPALTVDQKLQVQDMMARAQGRLAERAAQGDQQAQAALRMLQMNPQ